MTNEKRLIDANALAKNGWHLVKTGKSNEFLASMSLADVPTEDAVEVKHGHWTPLQKNGFAFGVTCSECNTTWDDKSNYCPNCGADMRERKDNG